MSMALNPEYSRLAPILIKEKGVDWAGRNTKIAMCTSWFVYNY